MPSTLLAADKMQHLHCLHSHKTLSNLLPRAEICFIGVKETNRSKGRFTDSNCEGSTVGNFEEAAGAGAGAGEVRSNRMQGIRDEITSNLNFY